VLTIRLIEEMMMASLQSPLDLCDRLGLHPTTEQRELMERFAEGENPMDVPYDMGDRPENAMALSVLWHMLLVPGCRTVVIAADKQLGGQVMGFLQEVTMKIDPALTAVCRWPRWSTLKIGHDAGYECRLVSNRPALVAGLHSEAMVALILGAGSADPAFCETREALEGALVGEKARIVRMW